MKRTQWTRLVRLAIAALVAVGLSAVGLGGSTPGAEAQEPPGLARAIEAKERNVSALMARPGVVGVGVGVNAQGEPVIRVLLERGGIEGVPDVVDRIKVETVVTGMILARCHVTTDGCEPAPLGVSIGHPDVTAGTLGALVTRDDGTGDVFILSNNHVLANINNAEVGDSVLQPGTADGGTDPADSIGTLAAYVPLDFSGSPNSVDAAIASVDGPVANETLPSLANEGGYGTPSSTPLVATPNMVGMEVQKCGRTTGCTTGQISTVSLDVSVCYQTQGPRRCKKSAWFEDQIGITGSDGAFSAGGDSGSLIVDTFEAPDPVGLLFAGSSTMTIANRIDDVLTSLGVEMLDGNVTPNTPPTVTITAPPGDVTIAPGQTITFTGTANDSEDGDLTAELTWTSDQAGLLGTGASLSTDALSTGTHLITASVTDSGGTTRSDSITVTVANTTSIAVHVGNLNAWSVAGGRGGKWDATVTITVHDPTHVPAQSGVTVNATWDGGNASSCVTDGLGVCSITRTGLKRNAASTTFSVNSLSATGTTYDPGANHDPVSATIIVLAP